MSVRRRLFGRRCVVVGLNRLLLRLGARGRVLRVGRPLLIRVCGGGCDVENVGGGGGLLEVSRY